MGDSDTRVVPGPTNYFPHSGSLKRPSGFFSAGRLSRAVWVYGECTLAGTGPLLPAAFHLPGAKRVHFIGHYNERNVAELMQVSDGGRAIVIGMGGGALSDSTKVPIRRLEVPLVAIPTIAAICTVWIPLLV